MLVSQRWRVQGAPLYDNKVAGELLRSTENFKKRFCAKYLPHLQFITVIAIITIIACRTDLEQMRMGSRTRSLPCDATVLIYRRSLCMKSRHASRFSKLKPTAR
jgi:hypothetical protein